MAAQGSTSNPIIVEPPSLPNATQSQAGSLSSSPEPHSSPNSRNSSRPQSQCNSDTSQSDPPSPSERKTDTPVNKVSPLTTDPCTPIPPAIPSLLQSSPTPVSQPSTVNQHPRSVPPPASTVSSIVQENTDGIPNSRVQSLRKRITRKRWVESTIGLLGLITAIWLGVRGYKLAVWQSWDDLRQTCATYKQSGVQLGHRCTKLLEEGDPPTPPYWIGKWASTNYSISTRSLFKRNLILQCVSPSDCFHDVDPSHKVELVLLATLMGTVLLLIGLLFWMARGQTRTEDVVASAARRAPSDVQITRHHDDGPETVSGQGIVIKERPHKDFDLPAKRLGRDLQDHQGQSHSRVPDWSSYSSSAETLVTPWNSPKRASKVSLHDHSANEKHEGLIELDVAGKRKAFFKPSTGEMFHLAPWKSTHSSDEDSDDESRLKSKAAEKNSTHRALGQMIVGGVSWAAGKRIDKKVAEKLQEHEKRRQPPQRAGDCLAGEVTNEWPSGRPHLA